MKRLHLICNAHIDPVWQWTWDEGIAAAIATFRSAADLCDEFDYIFCHNESLLYEAVEKHAPELFERIKKQVKAGKWKIAGGWYLQPDCNMPSGESFVRQIYVGKKYFKEKFGVEPTTAINYDSFGHSIGLPQILKKNGYDSYICCRPGDDVFLSPGHFFRWTSPDGSSVIVAKACYYNSGLGHATDKIKDVAKGMDDVDYVLWGVGNHGGGPSRKDLHDIEELKIEGVEIIHSNPENLFKDNIKISGDIDYSMERIMPGCYTSMAKIKQAHRETENLLYSTEKLLSSAMLAGYKPDLKALDEAQKQLLLAEFHDILPGSSVPDGESQGLELLNGANKIIKDYRTGAFLYLVMGEKTAEKGEFPIFVYNFAPYEVTCPIEAEFSLADQNWDENKVSNPRVFGENGEIPCQQIKPNATINLDWRKRIVFEGTLKPLGITRFSVYTDVEEKTEQTFGENSLKNLLAKNKILSSPVSLKMYDDTADPWGMSREESIAMGKNPVDFELMSEEESAAFCAVKSIKPEHIIEDGAVFTGVEQFVKSGNTRGVIEYRFFKKQPFVDLKITLEFADKNKLVRLKVPAPKGVAVGDGPYVVERKGSTEVPIQKWAGVETDNGIFSVINDRVYGCQFHDDSIEFTLIRGAGYLFHPIGGRDLYPQDRYLKRIDCGRYEYNFRIFVGNKEEVCLKALEFAEKPYAVNVFPIESGKKEFDIHTDAPVLMSVCKTDDEKTVFRFFNPLDTDKTFNLYFGNEKINVDMKKAEVVSVLHSENKLEVIHDSMPV